MGLPSAARSDKVSRSLASAYFWDTKKAFWSVASEGGRIEMPCSSASGSSAARVASASLLETWAASGPFFSVLRKSVMPAR